MSNVNPPVTTTKAELNRYFQMIDRRVPISVSQFIRWLRMPSSFAIRLVIAMLLILGGIFSFLPILGLWMLPLGLLLVAQRRSLRARASSGCVCVGRGEVEVAKSEMEKPVRP
jgi:uncharacterized membrane protein